MVSFRKKEFRDIFISVIVLAVAVSGIGFQVENWSAVLTNLAVVSLPLVVGFFSHEVVHKTVAENFGYESYYQMWPQGLVFALLLGVATSGRFIFAAPGAVMIQARNVSEAENGIISFSGPITNLAVAGFFYIFTFSSGLLASIGSFGVFINMWLAFFNLLPLGPLDGKKIFSWKPFISISMLGLTGFLLFFVI